MGIGELRAGVNDKNIPSINALKSFGFASKEEVDGYIYFTKKI